MSGLALTTSASSSSHVVVDIDNLNTPLHVAASIGLSEYTREILEHKLGSALCINKQGLTPLHIACANGHLSVVKVIVGSKVGHELCRVPDKDGMLPIHSAAARGRVDVLHELMEVCSETTVLERSWRGDNILHLAVKSGNVEAIKFLLERLAGDIVFLNSPDAEGNTIVHLAAARKQLEIVKILMNKCGSDNLNARNKWGMSVLDVALQPPQNAALEWMVRTAGGTTTKYKCRMMVSKLLGWSEQLWEHMMSSSSASPRKEQEELQARDRDQHKGTQKTLMIVSILLATVTFQAAMTPPLSSNPTSNKEENNPNTFILLDTIAPVTSLSTILVMICGCGGWKYMTRLMLWMTWTSVFFTLLAFLAAVFLIYGDTEMIYLSILGNFAIIFMAYLGLRLQLYVLSKLTFVPCVCKINMIPDHPSYDHRRRALLLVRRAGIFTAFTMISFFLCYYFLYNVMV